MGRWEEEGRRGGGGEVGGRWGEGGGEVWGMWGGEGGYSRESWSLSIQQKVSLRYSTNVLPPNCDLSESRTRQLRQEAVPQTGRTSSGHAAS